MTAPHTTLNRPSIAIAGHRLVLAICGLALFVVAYPANNGLLIAFVPVAIGLPLLLAASRAWAARRDGVEYGLLRHPLRRDLRWHLAQGVNVWLFTALLGAAITAGSVESGRLALSSTVFDAVHVGLWLGLILMAALALVPLRRVHIATNILVIVLSGFLAMQLGRIALVAPSAAVVLDSPVRGDWFVASGGRSALTNHHYVTFPQESHAIDLVKLGENQQTHTARSLSSYAGFGEGVYAPAPGRIIDVRKSSPDAPIGEKGMLANQLVIDIGGNRFVVMAHLKQNSVRVEVGDRVQRGQQLAQVGNSGESDEPHLHMHVQNRPYDYTGNSDNLFTYPMTFRDANVTPSGIWPHADAGELRSGDHIHPRPTGMASSRP
jgi:hypothetical protein